MCFDFPMPVFVTWHGFDANILPVLHGETMYNKLFQTPARHTVGSTFMVDRLTNLGASPSLVQKVPMGVDILRFSCKQRKKEQGKSLAIVSVG